VEESDFSASLAKFLNRQTNIREFELTLDLTAADQITAKSFASLPDFFKNMANIPKKLHIYVELSEINKKGVANLVSKVQKELQKKCPQFRCDELDFSKSSAGFRVW
jgi:hypothetical protein